MPSKKSSQSEGVDKPAPETKSSGLQQLVAPLEQETLEGARISLVPLEAIHTDLLLRDRIEGPDPELDDLVVSLREVGLSNPVWLEPRTDGDFELIQGRRRLRAFQKLFDETGAGVWAMIPALINQGAIGLHGLYRQMIDENTIRKNLSFAEMAQAAINFVDDPATEVDSIDDAVRTLFQSANYSKRSYIKTFVRLLRHLGHHLKYPAGISRDLGLALAKELDTRPELSDMVGATLSSWSDRTEKDELDVLRIYARRDEFDMPPPDKATFKQFAAKRNTARRRQSTGQIGDTISWAVRPNAIRIKADCDFSQISQLELSRAISGFLSDLSGLNR